MSPPWPACCPEMLKSSPGQCSRPAPARAARERAEVVASREPPADIRELAEARSGPTCCTRVAGSARK
eukprot:2756437-Alexandrium_andersonii.AAC.1